MRLHGQRQPDVRVHDQARTSSSPTAPPLTAEDVVFSFERNVEDRRPERRLLAAREHEERRGQGRRRPSIFHLKAPDATWPSSSRPAPFAIVPSDTYPGRQAAEPNNVVGSGRYAVAELRARPADGADQERQLHGRATRPRTTRSIIQYFDKASALKLALEQGDVDIAYRSLSPTDLDDLEDADGVNVVSGNGIEIRYLVFNLDLQPGDNDDAEAGDPPGRRARRSTVRRSPTTSTTAPSQPLYSMVPQGLQYATEPFKTQYGDEPGRREGQADPRRTPASRRRCRWRSGTRRRTTAPRLGRRVRRDQAPARRQRACST